MGRRFLLPLLLVTGVTLAGCSKKKEPASNTADAAAPGAPAPATPEEPSVRFRVPGSEASPTPAQETPAAPAGTPAPAAGSGNEGVQMPEIAVFYPPFYPLTWRMEGVEGKVVLDISIDETGAVANVEVGASTAPQFKDYALEAARLWRFLPARENGKPIPYRVAFPVSFVSEFGSGQLSPQSPLAGLIHLDGTYYVIGSDGGRQLANVPDPVPLLRVRPPVMANDNSTKEVRVSLSFTVTEQGQVTNAKLIESSQTDFDQAALTAVRFWQFIPRMREGRPVTSTVRLPIVYNPNDPAEAKAN